MPHCGAGAARRGRGRTCRGRRRTGSRGSSGASAMPSSPRSQKLWTFVRRSANTVGVVSERLSKTLISPLFSATKTRPSEAKRTTVGFVEAAEDRRFHEACGHDAGGRCVRARRRYRARREERCRREQRRRRDEPQQSSIRAALPHPPFPRFSPRTDLPSRAENSARCAGKEPRGGPTEARLACTAHGGVPERSNGAVSKTVRGASLSRVQISPPPP